MMANRNVARAVRLALIAAGTASAGVYAPGVVAQDTELEQIVVTGSRIARPDYESASPVVTVSEQLFEQSSSSTVETVLNTLPQFVPSVTSTSNNPSNGGQANVELRGLGTTRTLVLLDGRRIIPANASGVVDLNMIPAGLIQGVEIMTGGASAVYGSDPIAGVVNFKLRDMQGLEFDGSYGVTGQGDGNEYSVGLSGGMHFADGRGKVMGAVNYANRDGVLQGDRKFSRAALGYAGDGVFAPLGSATIPEGRYDRSTTNLPTQAAMDAVFAKYGVAAGAVSRGQNLGFNSNGSPFSIAPVYNYTGPKDFSYNQTNYTYNYAPPNYMVLPLERTTAFARGEFEINSHFTPYAQVLWADYNAKQQLAATPGTGFSVPATNPYIPADLKTILASRTNPNGNFTFRKRFTEIGPRISDTDYSVYQIIGGVKGDIAGDWTYDAYYSYGKNDISEDQYGNISYSAVQRLLTAADGGKALCGGFNPFGIGNMSQACGEYVSIITNNKTSVEQEIFEASATGSVFDLPAGALKTAVGGVYRKDTFDYQPDEALFTGDVVGFNANDPVKGDTDVTELYVEALVPILKDIPGIKSLDLTLGYRWSDYSTAGNVSSYKGELAWQIFDPIRLRGSYQRAVRAPNIGELYTPQQQNFPSIQGLGDPCSADNAEFMSGPNAAQVKALCVAQGIPAASLPFYTYSNSQVEGLSGGNPDLQEETADTYAVGLVFTSPWDGNYVQNLQMSVDWYSIEIEDAIGSIDASTFIERCYLAEYNPSFAADNYWCSFFRRDADTGEITDALEVNANLGSYEVAGIDVQLDWRFDLGPGAFGLNWIVSWLDKYDVSFVPGDKLTPYAGTAGDSIAATFPEWKSSFNVGYTWGGLGANLRWRYIDSLVDFNEPDFDVPSKDYFDFSMSYAVEEGMLDGLTIRGGVENLTDEDPEIYPSYVQMNTDPSLYDTLGRRYFIGVNYAFGGSK
jgi:outer membrane receptor protein involved in Fe transport